jgi:hypothetical protein
MSRGPVSISNRRLPYSIRRRVQLAPVVAEKVKSEDDEPIVIEDDEPKKVEESAKQEVVVPAKGKGKKGKKQEQEVVSTVPATPEAPTGIVLPTEPEPVTAEAEVATTGTAQ